MTRLALIVGFGGYNAAGRSSFHHAYRRMVLDALDSHSRQETLAGLAVLCKQVFHNDGHYHNSEGEPLSLDEIEQRYKQSLLDATLVRKIEQSYYAVDGPDASRDFPVKAAGQLPSGFKPAEHYSSRFHPRGLQLAILGASDALHASGLDWQQVKNTVKPDEIAVYASSAMGQLDDNGIGGLIKARLEGKRATAKQLALGLNSMPADFINAYVLGNVGSTASITGACASFLYNLKSGIEAIQQQRARVVLVGCSEAPITPEIMEGYTTMGALGTDDALKQIEHNEASRSPASKASDQPDHRRASRPFGDNCGFTIAESSQFFVLMDDELALELGAQIHGAASHVFVHADGYKKSIPAPGPGNYLTLAKAVKAAVQMLGIDTVRKHSILMAHGSSTPQNRVTESALFDKVAAAFDIRNWPVAAVKAYLGHPLASASGDQLSCALGCFAYQILPGIKTIDKVCDDVVSERLRLSKTDIDLSEQPAKVAFLNSKGFGGNNASAVIVAPDATLDMLAKRHGSATLAHWKTKLSQQQQQAKSYDQAALTGDLKVIYRFGEGMIDEHELAISEQSIRVPGFAQAIDLSTPSIYQDMALESPN